MAFADDLLEQARHLARREKKKPKQASLRRAVSTAYYAVFHLLVSDATRNWKHAEHRAALGRAFDHGKMKGAAEKKKSQLKAYFRTDPRPGLELSAAKHLWAVAEAFVHLQQERHAADYDSSMLWTRTQAMADVDAAADAFQKWNLVRETRIAQDFLVSFLVKDR